ERGPVVVMRLVEDPRAGGVAVEPPVELRRRHRLAVRLLHQRQEPVAPGGLDDHFEEVPSAALKTRRARVPVTVSLTAIRSHAPASTSSNVRGEYGSTLYRRSWSGSLAGVFAPETAVNATSYPAWRTRLRCTCL